MFRSVSILKLVVLHLVHTNNITIFKDTNINNKQDISSKKVLCELYIRLAIYGMFGVDFPITAALHLGPTSTQSERKSLP